MNKSRLLMLSLSAGWLVQVGAGRRSDTAGPHCLTLNSEVCSLRLLEMAVDT